MITKITGMLNRVLNDMQANQVNLPILLYQGSTSEATACAKAYPQFPAVLCLGEEDQPPARPLEVINRIGAKSQVIALGHKGKYIGVVGVYKTGNAGQPFTFRYTNVEMTEVTIRIATARDLGDLSENAEYHAAREDQGMLQARVVDV